MCDTESRSTTKHAKKGKSRSSKPKSRFRKKEEEKPTKKQPKKGARSRAEKRQATRRSCVFSCGSTTIAKEKLTSRCTFQICVLFPLPFFCKSFASFGLKLVLHARCEFVRLRSVRGCVHWCASISCSAVLVLACTYIFLLCVPFVVVFFFAELRSRFFPRFLFSLLRLFLSLLLEFALLFLFFWITWWRISGCCTCVVLVSPFLFSFFGLGSYHKRCCPLSLAFGPLLGSKCVRVR